MFTSTKEVKARLLMALQNRLLKWTAPEQQRSQKAPTCFNAGAAVHSATSKVNTCGLFLDKLALDRVGKKRRGDFFLKT